MTAAKRIFLATACLAAACSNDFVRYPRLTKLRVLAIAADPPAPASGEITTLSALVHAPVGEPVTSYAWSWCPAPGPTSAGAPCLVTEAELAAAAGAQATTVPSFDLGSAPTAMLANAVDPRILAALCQGRPGSVDKPDCAGGFPVQVKLAVASATETLISIYTLRLRFDPATPPNANPLIDGLTADVDAGTQAIGDDAMVVLPRRKQTTIHALVPAQAAETLAGDKREALTLSWFVESGDVSDARTGLNENTASVEDALKTKWTPGSEADYPDDTAHLFVVVRDSRGGVTWRAGVVRLGASP